MSKSNLAIAAVLVLGTAGTATPAAAQGAQTQFTIARVQSNTPQCRQNPNAPVVGRVSGIIGGVPSRGVSFVGCFDSFAACEAWRGPVSGLVSGRLTLNSCDERR